MKVLVTGADGLLGSNAVRELLKRGHEVNVFILPNSNATSLNGLAIKKHFGNILKPADIATAIEGCDAVIHIAANTSVWPRRSEIVRRVNIEGTQNIIDAAMKVGVKRFVHIGSASSFGMGTKESPGDENTPFAGGKYGLDYVDSKYEGQLLVLKYAKEYNFPALIVTPTFMFGPYDSKPGSGKIILAIKQKKMPAFTGGGKNFVFSKDVATAAVNALTMGRIGECYVAGGHNLSYKEMSHLVAEVLQVSPPRIKVPDIFIKTVGWLSTLAGRLFNIEPKVSYAMAKVACDGQYFTARKAIEELDMPQTDIRIAVKEAHDWFKESGYC